MSPFTRKCWKSRPGIIRGGSSPTCSISSAAAGSRRPRHERAQLLAVTSGSIAVTADGATFVAPPERAVWVPANTIHETRHLASTRLRTLYIAADAAPDLFRRTSVIQVGPLMRALIDVIIARPRLYDEGGADGRLGSVLLDQLAGAAALPLNLPIPQSVLLLQIAP